MSERIRTGDRLDYNSCAGGGSRRPTLGRAGSGDLSSLSFAPVSTPCSTSIHRASRPTSGANRANSMPGSANTPSRPIGSSCARPTRTVVGMLEKLQLTDCKAFHELVVNLRPLTVLLGPNNSGKSSIIAPIRLLAQTATSADPRVPLLLDGPLGDFGTYRDLVYGNHRARR